MSCPVRLPGKPLARSPRLLRLICIVQCFSLVLSACAIGPGEADRVSALPPLHLDEQVLSIDMAPARAPTPDLLVLDEPMRDFVERYTGNTQRNRQKLMNLHRAIRGSATLGIEYDPAAGGSASEVFYRGSANCLSYASLFVAMAREAGLDASYQWLEVRPQWSREGERILVRLHVNVDVDLKRDQRFMADIDPLASADIAGSRIISDTDAQALHHSNIAMRALAQGQLGEAWLNGVRALQLSPGMAHLWVNIGAVYRVAGQNRAAESSYMQALRIDPAEHSAMNNLVILYGMEGREEEEALWSERVARYRSGNPYYHAWQAQQASEAGDWQEAQRFYEQALSLSPGDSRLLYSLGMAHWELGESLLASQYLERAIESATLYSEISSYRAQLVRWRGTQEQGLLAES